MPKRPVVCLRRDRELNPNSITSQWSVSRTSPVVALAHPGLPSSLTTDPSQAPDGSGKCHASRSFATNKERRASSLERLV